MMVYQRSMSPLYRVLAFVAPPTLGSLLWLVVAGGTCQLPKRGGKACGNALSKVLTISPPYTLYYLYTPTHTHTCGIVASRKNREKKKGETFSHGPRPLVLVFRAPPSSYRITYDPYSGHHRGESRLVLQQQMATVDATLKIFYNKSRPREYPLIYVLLLLKQSYGIMMMMQGDFFFLDKK